MNTLQRHPLRWLMLIGAAALLLLAAVVVALNLRGEAALPADPETFTATAQQIERGAYLARAGNCAGCHTTRGGAAFAGGRGIATPFGTVYPGNLTPDDATGLGTWSSAHFWRALHHGRAKDGRLLYPAFPYTSYTQVTRADADALYAYLRSLPPAVQARPAHELRFPYDTQAALAVWRALYFRPGVFEPQAQHSAEWNRGAYLVRGLGHCIACHGERNALGATRGPLELAGGLITMQKWYAPSLASPGEAGVADWPVDDVVALLQHGSSPRGSVLGPMAEVVFGSTQHLSVPDLRAMAVFLKDLPQSTAVPDDDPEPPSDNAALARGARLYARDCAACHGAQGQGAAGAYPPLAGQRGVTMAATDNLVQAVLHGGFAPATRGNPRPYGMPPFAASLSDREIAELLSYVRQAWGNRAAPVSELAVMRAR